MCTCQAQTSNISPFPSLFGNHKFVFHIYESISESSIEMSITLFNYQMCACVLSHFSRVWLFATLWAVACQAPLSMGFSRQEYWSGLHSCPWDSPDKSTGVGCIALLQGIFLAQGSSLYLLWPLRWRWILYCWATGEALNYWTESTNDYLFPNPLLHMHQRILLALSISP